MWYAPCEPSPGLMRRSPSSLLCLLLTVALQTLPVALFASDAQGSPGPDGTAQLSGNERPLAAGEPLLKSISGGQTHQYSLALERGQALHLIVDQRGVDVAVTLSSPAGVKLAEADGPNGDWGPELLSLPAEESGAYKMEVTTRQPATVTGLYHVRVEELRAADERDQHRFAAVNLLREGHQKLRADAPADAAGKYEEARSAFAAARDRYGEAVALQHLGGSLLSQGSLDKGVTLMEGAAEVWRELGDGRGEIAARRALGAAYVALGEEGKASGALDRAHGLVRALGDRRLEAELLFSWATGLSPDQNQQTLDRLLSALAAFRDVGEAGGEADVLNSIGGFYFNLGERETAINYFDQAAALLRARGDVRTEAFILRNTGLALKEAGQYAQALDFMSRALPFFRANIPHQHATTLTLIGEVHALAGERDKALDHFNQALQIRRGINHLAQPVAYPRLLLDLARLYKDSGERGKALDFLDQALVRIPDVPYVNQHPKFKREAGLLYNSLGHHRKAEEILRQALELDRSFVHKGGEAETLAALARAERDLGRLADARANVEAAILLTESLRAGFKDYQLRAAYTASVQQYYDLLIDILMRLDAEQPKEGFTAAALEASERKRARSLLELLAEGRVDVRRGADPTLIERERYLQRKLNAYAARQSELLSGKHTVEQAAALASEITLLTSEYQRVQAEIRRRSPRYAALSQPAPLSVGEIQREVLDNETVLLEYALGDERSFLWAVTRGSIKSYELPRRSEIEAEARKVYELMTARNRRRSGETLAQRQADIARSDREYEEFAARLSRTVLGPVLPALGSRRLLVVADGALQYIPFAALPKLPPDGAGGGTAPPLVVEHEVVALPSASVLAVLRRETVGRRPAPRPVAVLADPVFDASDPRAKSTSGVSLTAKAEPNASVDLERPLRDFGLTNERGTLSRLPFSREEARAITSALPAGGALEALDFKASREQAVSDELAQYRVLHFATHGLLNTEQPALSGLVFSLVDEKGGRRDGFLRLHEIYNLNLPAELVVLSACQTGLGREVRGEGLLGLTRGFMYAGSRRVAASLWKVDDGATSELMGRFYREMLAKGKSPAAALRAAQVEMWRQRQWRAPYYWAAFVLQGEYE